MTPDEIEQLFSRSTPAGPAKEPPDDGREGEEAEASLSSSETALRTGSLGPVLATVKHLWETGSEQLDAVAEKIGNGARVGEPHLILHHRCLLYLEFSIYKTVAKARHGTTRPLYKEKLLI